MTRIACVEEADAQGETAAVYAEWHAANPTRDKVPDILKALSRRPDVLRQIVGMSYDLHFSDGYLPWKTKELLATYVSALNRCPYCVSSHAYFLEAIDSRADVAHALHAGDLDSAAVTDSERALLKFAGLLTQQSWRTSDEDVAALRTAGWNEDQIAEAVYVIAMFNLFNRVANAFGLESSNYRELLNPAVIAQGFANPYPPGSSPATPLVS